MGYVINPVIFPWQIELTTAQCLAGGFFNIPQFAPINTDQYYIIVGIPVVFYKFNTVDFDNLDALISCFGSGNFIYRIQMSAFTGQSEGFLLQANTSAGLNDSILPGEIIGIDIQGPPTVGDGSIQVNGFAQVINIV